MNISEKELLHELLKHRYGLFYFAQPNNRETALRLHEMGYFNDELGQVTEQGQEYFDNIYLNVKEKLLAELKSGGNRNYNKTSSLLGFEENTLYLHHFMRKLENEQVFYYREGEDFNSDFKVIFR